MKREVATRKRRIRCAAPIRRTKVVGEYLESKGKYEEEAKKAQIASWKSFCGKQDREGMWEGIYRVIGKTSIRKEDLPLTKNGQILNKKDSATLLAEIFYPEDDLTQDGNEHKRMRAKAEQVNVPGHDENHDPTFTSAELMTAIQSFNPKKAPGSDGLTSDICARAITATPGIFLSLARKCLELGHFPTPWKEATVVVLRKPGKDNYTEPKSYRPIGLLPVMGKILEKMLVSRIKWHLIPKMSPYQYGFMPQKSTEDSLYDLMNKVKAKLADKKIITLISLDIEGAFDGAWWPAIRLRLAEEECPVNVRRLIDSYLSERTVKLRYAGEEVSRKTSKGCVQGSIGGPILWNLLLDPLLKGLHARGDYCQAFADDIVLMFHGNTGSEVQRRANEALDYVHQWGVRNKSKFAPHKTSAMVITNKLKYDAPLLNMNRVPIEISRDMKLLGLWIDDKLTFNKHVAKTCTKALNIYKNLSRAAKVSWGLHTEVIRAIYTAVVEPIICYGAGVWAPASKKLCVQKQLNNVQRGFAQKLCRAHRTVSLNSALVLAGVLPLDLRIQEAAALYEARRGILRPELGDREIERKIAFADIPHPAQQIVHQFECINDAEQLNARSGHEVRIFTDGSKIDGKVGAALSLWGSAGETKCRKLKLPSHCTVYQAELVAIYVAMDEIAKSAKQSFAIYSDSRSALQTVTNNCSLHPLAVQTRGKIKDALVRSKSVDLYWVKAHAGLEGNERADELAKDAALNSKARPVYDKCPVSFVKRYIRAATIDEWNRRYKTSETASTTKVFFPEVTHAYRTVRELKPDGILTQMFTGHGGFSQYLHRFKLKDNPSCPCEPDKDETPVHVLTECPIYGRERYEVEQEIGCRIERDNLCKILRDNDIRDKFLDYCTKIVTKVVSKNKNIVT